MKHADKISNVISVKAHKNTSTDCCGIYYGSTNTLD